MNKEIDFKKFLLCLLVYVLFLSVGIGFFLKKVNPFCKVDSPCMEAICTDCESNDGKKECHDCSILNEDDERIWVGSCIFKE